MPALDQYRIGKHVFFAVFRAVRLNIAAYVVCVVHVVLR